ncbi:class I SAM-dependent methyltransferase [Halobacterium litoreum]|uniref:Class I SAM-dependent methyltransferase n=1 Tax=Halobacterium litoreum TaxID=2039234 RepID=A0ABD5NH51_9EURY|nr:methyltransferase domain-containing protein [Halobacterium litoreum]UHH12668.1 class I SAM-dependent methyltransferase [Halobacterium litoreum]
MDAFQNTAQPDWDWWSRLWPTPGATLRDLGVTADDAVAEVPSGNGYFALPAARITDPNTVYAVDRDASLLDELAHLADQHAIGNVEPIRGDARDLASLLPERVDVVLVANTFHGVDDRTEFVREAVDALADGGRLVVVNWHDRPREETAAMGEPRGPPTDLRLSPDETEAAVRDAADVTLAERVELPPHHYALVFEA